MFTFNTLPAWLAFVENGGDAGGSGDGDQGGQGDQGTGGDGGQSGGGEYKPPATQAELDRIVQGRIARAEKATREQFADYDDLRAFRDSHETDVEKAVSAARDEARAEVEREFGRKLAEVEVRASASTLRFHDPADAIRHLDDIDGLVKGGAVDAKAITEQLQKLAETKPYLLDAPARGSLRRPGPKRDGVDVTDTPQSKTGEKRSVGLLREYSRR